MQTLKSDQKSGKQTSLGDVRVCSTHVSEGHLGPFGIGILVFCEAHFLAV